MKLKLIKGSMPGWIKEFDTEQELKTELFSHLCAHCCNGEKITDDDGNIIWETDPVGPNDSIDEMLSTGCGLEFYVELDDER